MKNKSCCTPKRNEKKNFSKDNIEASKNIKFQEQMIRIEGGSFLMGTEDKEGFPADGEGPIREVKVDSFYIDQTAVTNEQFALFIKETNYITEAETFGWSFVFHLLASPHLQKKAQRAVQTPWWLAVEGAKWDTPEGPGSSIKNRMDHPVVHVSFNDALAYCKWANKRLPTEAEWEYAARGGLVQKKYVWGDELTPNGEHMCNIWQGKFPTNNTAADGYLGTAPVKTYKPNGYHLYNMAGNVWEWCSDWFSPRHNLNELNNPKGPKNGMGKVMRGGSYLCHDSYCNRYRVAARTANTPDSSTGNLGFRCVTDVS